MHTNRYPTELPIEEIKNILAFIRKSDPTVDLACVVECGWWVGGYCLSLAMPHTDHVMRAASADAAITMNDEDLSTALSGALEAAAALSGVGVDWNWWLNLGAMILEFLKRVLPIQS